jgi:lipopolysaccharide export LptBFGC system permease protein LptF
MKKIGLLLMAGVITATSIFTACKKKEEQTPPEKVCTLTKVFDADGNLQTEYIYVGDKLSKVNSYASNGTDIQSVMNISYDASGNISKVDNADAQGNVSESQTYEYNPSGTVGTVHIIANGKETAALNFDYNGVDPKKPSRVRVTTSALGAPMEVAYVDYSYDANGNNNKAVTYIIDMQGSGDYKKQSTVTYEFDAKKNPSSALAKIMLDPSLIGPNNVTKQTTTDEQNGGTTSIQNAYEYTTEGYPSKNTSTDDSGKATITTMEYSCK